jgi:hypothetical protein
MQRWTISAIIILWFMPLSAQQPKPDRNPFKSTAGAASFLFWDQTHTQTAWGVFYSPQYNLYNSFSDLTLSVSAQPGAGMSLSGKGESNEIIFDLPFMLEINLGHLASRDFYAPMGFFAGGGYDFHKTGDGEIHQAFVATTGLRWWMFKKSFTARYILYFSGDKDGYMSHSISLGLNLGKYLDDVRANNKVSRFMSPFRK